MTLRAISARPSVLEPDAPISGGGGKGGSGGGLLPFGGGVVGVSPPPPGGVYFNATPTAGGVGGVDSGIDESSALGAEAGAHTRPQFGSI